MKQSKTTLKELIAAYRAVLRHGILCNAIALGLMSIATPAMAGAPNTSSDNPAWVFGDVSITGAPVSQATFGGRRMEWNDAGTKYKNDLPQYQMIGRSLNVSNSDVYVGPVILTLRELTDNDALAYNYQKETDSEQPGNEDIDLAKVGGITWADYNPDEVWNPYDLESDMYTSAIFTKVAGVIGDSDALYTAPGVRLFATRDNSKTASSMTFDNTTAKVNGSTINADSVTVKNASLLTFVSDTTLDLPEFDGGDIASNGVTTLSVNNINIDGSRLEIKPGAKLVINPSTKATIKNVETTAYGALTVNGGGSIETNGESLEFSNNTSAEHGAALYFKDQAYGSGETHPSADSVVLNTRNITFMNNGVINTNKNVPGSGGAIFATGGSVSLLGENIAFTNNYMNGQIAEGRKFKVGGGAIANQSYAVEKGANKGATIDADMVIGKDSNSINTFTTNTSSTSGGAIMNRAVDDDGGAYLTINGVSTFTGNEATINGGAIYNVSMSKEVEDENSDSGWSVAKQDASVKLLNSSVFDGNKAGERGGAIYNSGTMTLNNAVFTGNRTTTDYANEHYYASQGGAIYNSGLDELGDYYTSNGVLTINGATFGVKGDNTKGNSAVQGGAIANSADETSFGGFYETFGTITLNNTNFYYNLARADSDDNDGYSTSAGGAIWNDDGNITVNGNTEFVGNAAVGYDSMGGAIRNGYGDMVFNDVVTFDSNVAEKTIDSGNGAQGGAISNEGMLTFKESALFKGNKAFNTVGKTSGLTYLSKGGAIYNEVYGAPAVITFEKAATFEGNSADLGGAVFVDSGTINLSDVSFKNNVANIDGAAVFNYGGIINLSGVNKFTGNKAGDVANDIYNIGTLTVASGTTTIDGGIAGNGDLTIADGATLNIGTASISQGTVDLQGTLIATVRDGTSQINVGEFTDESTGSVKLALDKAGTYHVFGNSVFNNVDVSSSVFDLNWVQEGKDLVASVKTAEKIAESTGLATESATAISNIAKAETEPLQELSVKLQEKLATGDTEAVEHATKAVHPETESVAQSVSTSVQNTVVNLASARMAMPAVGRNGGDVELTSGGVWVQGLFNKSKQNDAFNGYTRGIAIGSDATINKHWTIGAGYSFAHSDINGTARNTEIDSNTIFVYGQYKPSEWYMNAIANYTMSDYSERGTVIDDAVVTGNYDVDSFGGSVNTGYDFASGVTPELGLRYMHISAEDYANSYGIKTHMDDSDFLTGVAGVKYAFDITATKHLTFAPKMNAGIKYDLLSDDQVATVAMPGLEAYTLDGRRLKRIGGEFGIGLGMNYRDLEVSVNYDIDVREDYTSQTGMLKFRYNF